MKTIHLYWFVCCLLLIGLCIGGCGDKFFDPTQVGRFKPVPAVNVILDSLGVAEETSSAYEGAEEPIPSDTMVYETDYVFGPGDVVRISIYELLTEGELYVNDYVVTETGKISIPEVGVVEASGFTESQLEEQIKQILSPSLLKEPSVSVTLRESQQRTFAILGNGVPRPNRYPIPRYDYRLTDALAEAGGISQFNISYVYVSRPITGSESLGETPQPESAEVEKAAQPAKPEANEPSASPEREMLEIIAPRAQHHRSGAIISVAEMAAENELPANTALPQILDGNIPEANEMQKSSQVAESNELPGNVSSRETIAEPINKSEAEHVEWIFKDGKWVPVQVGSQKSQQTEAPITKQGAKEQLPQKSLAQSDWTQIETGGIQARVIKVPADKLLGGDPRYNIVIRPGDSIVVPVDIIGEFSIMGNTNFQGYIELTGRKMTLKMAIAAAGGLGPLAWPKNCEVVRRIGQKKEEIVMVDLDKIASGEHPDFFIKPDDLINVGTHSTARWRAVLRNAFRATYGFGFIYDRNFADRDFGLYSPVSGFFRNVTVPQF